MELSAALKVALLSSLLLSAVKSAEDFNDTSNLRQKSRVAGLCAQLIEPSGFPCSEHNAQTKDGFVLGLQRVSSSSGNLRRRKGPPVLLIHGLFTFLRPCLSALYLGEEYSHVLGLILGALKTIVNVIDMTKMTPPIKDLLPRPTPILKNCHEKVQKNCIDLVGRIIDRGVEFVPVREWMRICFELLEMLKAHKKGIRRATVNTFDYIAN